MERLFGSLLEVVRDPSDSGKLNEYHWEHNYTNHSIKVSSQIGTLCKHRGSINREERRFIKDQITGINGSRNGGTFSETVDTSSFETVKTESANYLALIQERDEIIALKNAEVCIL